MSDQQITPEPNHTPETPISSEQPQQTIVEEIIYEDEDGLRGNGCRGCIYGIVGAGGCFAILVVLLIGAILVSRPAVEQVFDGIVDAVSGEQVTRNITAPVVERIQNLSELKTVRYNFSNIVQSAVEMPPLLAGLYGENIIMVAVGHIEAGIDLAQLSAEDAVLIDDTLTITLPAPMILSCFLDDQQSEVVERSRGVFAPANVELDNAARRFALRQFLDLALEDGILLDAANEAQTTIEQLVEFGMNDGENIELVIAFAEADPTQPLPETCPT